MIINTRWLLDYLEPKCSLPELLASFPRVGLDVEATHLLGQELQAVRIGFIRSKKPLEGTDKFICEIEVSRGDIKQIVCASAHPVEVGWGVPVALAGTELPTGASIHEEHFHNVLSQGMICLDGELGLVATGSGLQVFYDESLLGKSLTEAISVDEALVHVKVYPNRPDCLGLIGIAREVAAILGLNLVLPKINVPNGPNSTVVPVEILDPLLCPRYTCRVISGVRIAKSPSWLASRLLATGSRPINNVVDITNFVLQEWGHPLHAFDLEKVSEKVVVRRFRQGESLLLLDGRTVTGSHEQAPLAIADSRVPMALAGIMGGEPTSITENTADVLLEAAYFEPTGIRRSSRHLGVSSDSSYRFERGVDPNETLDAARERATALLFSDAAAKSSGPVTDAYPSLVKRTVFAMPAERVSGYLGIPVTDEQVISSLTRLGYQCSEDLRRVEVPTRRVDVNDPVVLIEDVARVIGYEKIAARPSAETPTAGQRSALDLERQTIREMLTRNGFLEVRGVPLAPLGNDELFSQLKGESVVLSNPLNADLARMRRSLLPFLLDTAEHNAKRRATEFRYFEIDKIFSRAARDAEEHWSLGIVMGGLVNDSDWSTRREADFFDLKGTVESLLETIRVPRAIFEPTKLEGYLDGTAASIVLNDSAMGVIGQISPDLLASRKIQTTLFAAEIFIEAVRKAAQPILIFEPLPRFPAVFRDLSFVVKKEFLYEELERTIRSAAGPYLESVDCIDVFAGKSISKDSRSIAVSMVFRAPDRTLSSDEVAVAVDQIISQLASQFGAELRSS